MKAIEMRFIMAIKGSSRLDRIRNVNLRKGIVDDSLRE